MDVRILGWRYQNIRGMRDVTIDLGDQPPRWTLIQMPNGTGKTTTLTLMRVALSDEELSVQNIRSFRPDDQTDAGEFQLRLSVDGERCWLFVKFDYDTGTLRRFTSRAATDAGGLEVGRRLKGNLQDLLTPAFTRLFIFDGELAKGIRDLSKDEASRAIHTLYRLDRVDNLRGAVQRVLQSEQEAKAKTERGLGNLTGRYKTAESTLEELKQRKTDVYNLIESTKDAVLKLQTQKNERISMDSDARRRLVDATQAKAEVDVKIVGLNKDLLSISRNPAALADRIRTRLTALGSRLHQLKLPKTTSAEFFRELALARDCICGRPIGDTEREVITSRASEYLAENEMGVINAMKNALRNSDSAANPVQFAEKLDSLVCAMRDRRETNQLLDKIAAEREEAGDAELEYLREELRTKEGALRGYQEEFRRLTTSSRVEQDQFGFDWKQNIPLCEAELEEKVRQYNAALRTMRLHDQSQFVANLLRDIEERASTKLRDRVQIATNVKLESLIPGEHIRVARIGKALELASDQRKSKESVSEGQGLAVAYAFLASLFQDAPYRLPFVVDSPAVSLDTRVRREVADLIPGLFEQVIFFVISSEREGFADSFYGRAGARFITIESTASGVTSITEGIEAFKAFHSEEDQTLEGVAR